MDNQGFDNSSTVSVGEWMLTIFLTFIPLVNLIALIIWAFSSGTKPSKANWAKASLLWMVIAIALGILMAIMGVGIGMMGMNNYS
ncbi:hypothetical protein PSI9734_00844 [Pseudidiomarina piscicola]|uniref:Uncharacterized protein n=1 Tax=Pseudidiomarina piscicola TaxID=2614830 RepID=A0A6S6WK80_9GAMM|nr:hypothetical protein [Pseudidiomarina piscicola]CAB0150291.1 hypothetical protein PSI9734_00844 [Pseudidiomarina piscicola]VZT39719.1 hypothetical protein PSI9734_00844 [Pseudomonas aeruginosa]